MKFNKIRINVNFEGVNVELPDSAGILSVDLISGVWLVVTYVHETSENSQMVNHDLRLLKTGSEVLEGQAILDVVYHDDEPYLVVEHKPSHIEFID